MLKEFGNNIIRLELPGFESIDQFLNNYEQSNSECKGYSLSTFPFKHDSTSTLMTRFIPAIGGFVKSEIKPHQSAEYGLALWKDNTQISLISYNIINNDIDIVQRQNLSRKLAEKANISKSYTNISLHEALLTATYILAKNSGFDNVRSIPAHLQPSKNHLNTSSQQFKKTYNQIPLKCDFMYDCDLERFIKPC